MTDGSDVRQVTKGDHTDWYPRFSPDGHKLLFCRSHEKGFVSERDAAVREMIARYLDADERDTVAVQPRRNGRPLRDFDHDRLWRLHVAGASVRSIADAMGLPKSTVGNAIMSMRKGK